MHTKGNDDKCSGPKEDRESGRGRKQDRNSKQFCNIACVLFFGSPQNAARRHMATVSPRVMPDAARPCGGEAEERRGERRGGVSGVAISDRADSAQ